MFTTLMHRAVRLMPLLKPNRRLLIGGAWLFIIFSLAHLAWVISIKWGDPAGLTTLYQTTVDGETYRAWGLAYSGTLGLLLAISQFVIVTAGVVMCQAQAPGKTHRAWNSHRLGRDVARQSPAPCDPGSQVRFLLPGVDSHVLLLLHCISRILRRQNRSYSQQWR